MHPVLAEGWSSLTGIADVMRRGALTDAIFFDERTYRSENEDVAASVDAGTVRSSYDHYVRYGKWEGRRFALRRFGLGDVTAARAFAVAAALEKRLDALACTLTPGEIAHRLRSVSGERLAKPVGPWKRELDHGPWRATLPTTPRGGWVMVHARIAPVRAPIAFRMLDAAGSPLGVAAMFCKPTRSVQRMMRVPAGAAELELELLDRRLRTQPLRVRLRAVPDALVEDRMLRRLVHHDPACLGRSASEVRERFRREARNAGCPLRERLWTAYEGTFPRPVASASYGDWIERVEAPLLETLDREAGQRIEALGSRPRISILLPVFEAAEPYLRRCLASVQEQSYPDWELCVVDDASPSPHVHRVLEEHAGDPRVRWHVRPQNGHICRASNDALAAATGTYVALLDHDDVLSRHALLLVAEALRRHPEADVVYSDEDKLGEDGQREQPHFKPSFDPDLLLGQNYLGHLLVARTERVRAVGGFREGFEGSQDHDLALRLTEGASARSVVHIPHVLYHWRMSERSTAASSSAKPYTAEAGIRAVREALERRGERAEVEHAEVPHCYRVSRALPARTPRVSVIVPTRDAVQLLSTCIDTLLSRTDYPDFEVLVVDNGSVEPRALRYLERIETDERVRVLRDPRPFNFSALNNRAVERASGDVVVLLNNDVEVIDSRWLRELVANAVRPEVGCVGAKLLYPDGTLQHAGVVLGLHGLAGHPYRLMSGSFVGYYGRLTVTHSVSAVTAACLAIRRETYQRVGGLDEELAVAFNDVDFCLRVQQVGYRNLLAPRAVLVHHESATRGLDQAGAKRRRFVAEVALMKQRWGRQLYADPCYSPHLSLDHDDYCIRIPPSADERSASSP